MKPAQPLSPEELAREVQRLYEKLRPELPDIPPGDLILILQSVLRPPGSGRRYFLKRQPEGGYVF